MTTALRKRILIIDDDTRNTFALKAVLKARGYECLSAHGALDGIGMLSTQHDIGVILLDMMMPEMDGYQALGILKSGPQKEVPVIAVTAQAMVGDRDKSLDAGADDYISKPIDIDVLVPVLEKYLK